jgi:hypothetical protein
MISIFLCIILILISISAHIISIRIRKKKGINILQTVIIFLPGLFLNIYFQIRGFILIENLLGVKISTFPFSCTLLYLILLMDYLVFSASPLLGDESPTSSIYLMLQKKKLTYDELKKNINNKNFILKRCNILNNSNMMYRNNDRYVLTDLGKKFIRLIKVYRELLGLPLVDRI